MQDDALLVEPESLLENGSINANGRYQNALSEEFEVWNVNSLVHAGLHTCFFLFSFFFSFSTLSYNNKNLGTSYAFLCLSLYFGSALLFLPVHFFYCNSVIFGYVLLLHMLVFCLYKKFV